MFAVTMRRENGITTVTAKDQDTGFSKKEQFNSSNDAFEAVHAWEREAQTLREEQLTTA